ncbi:MAG TPA: hypothetical protein VGO63_03645 [Candidatus Paceibacterota bacterium]|jgi:hypothetical protein|nr:hypothetical protein [Candidatus Paceibacterota bacterium]
MRLNTKNSFFLGYLFVMLIFWIGIQISHITDLKINLMWGVGITCIPTFAAIFGLIIAMRWGGLKSSVGRALIFLSLGTALWATGNWIWTYYNFFLNNEIPYPSLADVGYVLAVPLWAFGVLSLSKATGAQFSLKRIGGRIFLVALPIAVGIFSYYFLFVIARGSLFDWHEGILKIIFDLAYPIGDWIILTLALLIWGLSLKYLGGRYKWPVLIVLLGFTVMFAADFSFSYMTTIDAYYNGSLADLFFMLAMFLIGFGISSFDVLE